MDSFSNKSCVSISTDRTVNINLSDIACQTLIDTFKTWNRINDAEEHKEEDEFFAHIEQYQMKEVSKYSVDDVNTARGGLKQNMIADAKNYEEDGDELAAPVSIINLTGVALSTLRLEDEEESKNLVMGGQYREPTKVYQPIRVEFEGNYLPINSIDLSKLHSKKHTLNSEEIVYYGVHLNNMQKVLTVRTPFCIHNRTIFSYLLRIYGEDVEEFLIEPNEKLPLSKSMENKKCSISIVNNSEDWSESFSPMLLLQQLDDKDDKTFIAHGMSYTFISKSKDKDVEICYNLNLLVPIIMKNCLPFNIDIKIPGARQDYYILKGEESYLLAHDLTE